MSRREFRAVARNAGRFSGPRSPAPAPMRDNARTSRIVSGILLALPRVLGAAVILVVVASAVRYFM